MRAVVGWSIVSVSGFAVSVLGLVAGWPRPVLYVVIALFVVGTILTFPVRRDVPPPTSVPNTAFVRGDASGSSFREVYSDADVFVDGDAREALFWRVIHRARAGGQ